MLTIYRRHRRDCPHRKEGRQYRRCRCPIWVDGRLGGQRIRESLETNNWEQAERIVLEWQNEGQRPRTENLITLEQACQEFLADAEARKLREATIAKYRVLLRQLADFAAREGLRFLREFDLAWLRKFRASWTDSNISALKKLERLRAFFRFAQESGWIADNPALKLKNPIVTQPPTLPFTREEMMRILAACEQYPDNYGRTGQANAQRLRALVLLLRYSGLRIRDAVTLACDRIVNGRLFLYTAKTGVPVWCPLPDVVVRALEACPRTNPRYFFWSGRSKPKSAVGDWQRSLRKLFRLAGVPDGRAHRFRDTFAVELLLAGVPLERVSVLLGHRSIKVTERHYAPWVRARQEQLERDVRAAWERDPLVIEAAVSEERPFGTRVQ
jgi:integrase/recombinase XerD